MSNHAELPPYEAGLDDAVRELIDGLSDADIRQLHASLRRLGGRGWMDWLATHIADVEIYFSATPKMRSRQRCTGTEDRLYLTYGSILFAQRAAQLSSYFDSPDLWADRDSRDRRAARGALLWRANFEPYQPWPFDEPPDLGNPFARE